jgi:hypothetical protein
MPIARRHSFLSVTLICIVSAAPAVQASSNFEGFFTDVAVGQRNVNATPSSSLSSNGKPIPSTLSLGQTSHAMTVFAAGYNFPIASGYMFGIGANISPASGQAQQLQVQTLNKSISLAGIKPLYNYGIFLAPGVIIGNGLAYLKVGTQTQVNNSNTSPNFNGYLLGIGYKQLIDHSIYLFGEANYAAYEAQTTTRNVIASGQSINASVTTKPQGSRFLLGLGYQF